MNKLFPIAVVGLLAVAGVAAAHGDEMHDEAGTAQLISEIQSASTKEAYDLMMTTGAAVNVVEVQSYTTDVKVPRDAASGRATGKISVTDTDDDGDNVTVKEEGMGVMVRYHLFDETGDPVSVSAKTVSEVASEHTKDDVKVVVRGWDADKKEEIAKKIDAVAGKVFGMETALRNVKVEPEKVSVEIERPAKLFGFIPMAYRHAFTMDGKGNISHGRPWWLIFATNDASTFESDIKYVFQNNQTNLEFLKLKNITDRQSQAFQTLSNVLKTRHEAMMSAIRNMK